MEKWIESHLEFWTSTIYRQDSTHDQACKWNTLKQIKAFIERNPEEIERYSWSEIARHADIDLYSVSYTPPAAKNQRGNILPELLWLFATLLLAALFIVPTVKHYDAQLSTYIETNTTANRR